MICKTVDLYEYFQIERKGMDGGYLTSYVPAVYTEVRPKTHPAILVIPGGGYGFVSEREGEPVALAFLAKGYAAFTLKYTVSDKPYHEMLARGKMDERMVFPGPLVEAVMAMAYIRKNAEEFRVDPEHVAAAGFSAGGHLTGMLATLSFHSSVRAVLGDVAKLGRPDAVILSYAVLTTEKGFTHEGTSDTISGANEKTRAFLSLETRVTEESAPAFIWHTAEDDCVPVESAFRMAMAYRNAGVPFELHVFEKGWHGTSVVNAHTMINDGEEEKIGHLSAWHNLAETWLKKRGFCIR